MKLIWLISLASARIHDLQFENDNRAIIDLSERAFSILPLILDRFLTEHVQLNSINRENFISGFSKIFPINGDLLYQCRSVIKGLQIAYFHRFSLL